MTRRAVAPIRALPPGYQEVARVRLADRASWSRVALLVPALMVASAVLTFGLLFAYHAALGGPLVFDALPGDLPDEFGYPLIIAVLLLHEWLHGVAIARCGHRPRYGLKWYALFVTADGAFFRRAEFARVALAPLIVLTLGGSALMLIVPPGVACWVALAVIVNAAAAAGDVWMALVVVRHSPSALVQDEEDGIRVFAPVAAGA